MLPDDGTPAGDDFRYPSLPLGNQDWRRMKGSERLLPQFIPLLEVQAEALLQGLRVILNA